MLVSMIKTINEQQVEVTSYIPEYNLSHETDLKFSFPKLDVNLCDGHLFLLWSPD